MADTPPDLIAIQAALDQLGFARERLYVYLNRFGVIPMRIGRYAYIPREVVDRVHASRQAWLAVVAQRRRRTSRRAR
jgi:hypothetical protein